MNKEGTVTIPEALEQARTAGEQAERDMEVQVEESKEEVDELMKELMEAELLASERAETERKGRETAEKIQELRG